MVTLARMNPVNYSGIKTVTEWWAFFSHRTSQILKSFPLSQITFCNEAQPKVRANTKSALNLGPKLWLINSWSPADHICLPSGCHHLSGNWVAEKDWVSDWQSTTRDFCQFKTKPAYRNVCFKAWLSLQNQRGGLWLVVGRGCSVREDLTRSCCRSGRWLMYWKWSGSWE